MAIIDPLSNKPFSDNQWITKKKHKIAPSSPVTIINFLLFLTSVVLFTLSILSYMIFPIPILDRPTGQYSVGVTTIDFSSPECPDPFNPNQEYRIQVTIWYPAVKNEKLAQYPITNEIMGRLVISQERGRDPNIRSFVFNPINKVQSHSYEKATPLVGKKFPLILYNGGDRSVLGQNTMIAEDLASHGYIVGSVGHPYGTNIIYQDGSFILRTDKRIDDVFVYAWLESTSIEERFQSEKFDETNPITIYKYLYNLEVKKKAIIQNWENDNKCVLSYLKSRMNDPKDSFYKYINLNEIGVIGHSLGGFATGNLCANLDDVKACVFMDTAPNSDYFYTNMSKPSLFINAEGSTNIEPFIKANPNSPIEVITIKGADHYSFMEQRLLTPLYLPPYTYDLWTTYRALHISKDEIVKFIDKTLK